jgi:hypothetical protein
LQDITTFVREEGQLIIRGSMLLNEAKAEIYNLLKKDSYSRFKKTTEFKDFIMALKPYESDIHRVSMSKEEYKNIRDSGYASISAHSQAPITGRSQTEQ